jgi:hypothetical protein
MAEGSSGPTFSLTGVASQGTWYAVFDEKGVLVSTGTVIDEVDLRRKNFSWKVLDHEPTGKHWDGATFRVQTRPYLGMSVTMFKHRFTSEERQLFLKVSGGVSSTVYDPVVHDFLDMLSTMAMEGVRIDPQSNFVLDFLSHAVSSNYLTLTRARNIGAR